MPARGILLLGPLQSGKTSLFGLLCGKGQSEVSLAGTSHTAVCGSRGEFGFIDVPGVTTLFAQSEEEEVTIDALLALHPGTLLVVADARNLRRSLALALMAGRLGLPMVMAVNFIDEARLRGLSVDIERLAFRLGFPVVATAAPDREGLGELVKALHEARPLRHAVALPADLEQTVGKVALALDGLSTEPWVVAALLLAGDRLARRLVREELGEEAEAEVERVTREARSAFGVPPEVLLTELFHEEGGRLAAEVVTKIGTGRGWLEAFGHLAQHPVWGVPIAVAVTAALYFVVGVAGATWVVDWLGANVFDAAVLPWLADRVAMIPWEPVRAALMDPDFGIFPAGVVLALGLVLPVLLFFYAAFAILQDSGYLARLSVLLDRLLRVVGLNGRGVVPLAMGFSCITMALLTTRVLHTNRERIIASLLLMMGIPCAPLLGMMLVVLGPLPVSASLFVFGWIGFQMLVVGVLASRLLPGQGGDFIMELPPMRFPRLRQVARMTWTQTWRFVVEALPFFALAAVVLFLFNRLGGLDALQALAHPLVNGVLGLPDEAVQVFMKTLIRREAGATELSHQGAAFSNVQLVVTLLVMTFLSPCVNAVLVLFKERGARVAGLLLAFVTAWAFVAGALASLLCRWFGVTFE
jgi:ferrous iron transport protein B